MSNTVTISGVLLTKLVNAAIERQHVLIVEIDELEEQSDEWNQAQTECDELEATIAEATQLLIDAGEVVR